MNKIVKNEIQDKLVFEAYYKGLSDTKWQKEAEKIAKKHELTLEEILEEYNRQFDVIFKLIMKRKHREGGR